MGTVILGSGIAGISAGYHLKKSGDSAVIYEKNSDWGGLCGNFTIDGFRFDKFVHFTFAPDEYTKNIFEASSPTYSHPPVSYNYWKGYWLKHPAQNNLWSLPPEEKVKIIEDFVNRPQKEVSEIKNYEEWLRVQYGNYFAENFPFKYTRKYWGVDPSELETKWVGRRLHVSPLGEVLFGSYKEQAENFYYTKCMKYPKKGGFRSILNKCREGLDIRFNKEVVEINTEQKEQQNKIITFIVTFLLMFTGLYYLGLSYVPLELYDTQTMTADMPEHFYVDNWCKMEFGRKEAVLWDMTRVDCLTKDYAIEFDFAKKWAESVGQSIYYAELTHKNPAVVLILKNWTDLRYVKRVERLNKNIQIFLVKAF